VEFTLNFGTRLKGGWGYKKETSAADVQGFGSER
jgi:hypothetical protein